MMRHSIALSLVLGLTGMYSCSGKVTNGSDDPMPSDGQAELVSEASCRDGFADLCDGQRHCVSIKRSPTVSDFYCAMPCDGSEPCPAGDVCRTSTNDYDDFDTFCLPPQLGCEVTASAEDCECFHDPMSATRIRGFGEDCTVVEEEVPVCYRPGGSCGDMCVENHWRYDLGNGEALWLANYADDMNAGWVNVDPVESCPAAPGFHR